MLGVTRGHPVKDFIKTVYSWLHLMVTTTSEMQFKINRFLNTHESLTSHGSLGNKPILLCCLWLCEVGPWENSLETISWVFDSSGEFEEITMRWSLSEFRLTFTEKCALSNVMLGAIFQFFSYASLPPPQARVGKDTCFMPDVMTSGSPVRWRLTFCVNWKKFTRVEDLSCCSLFRRITPTISIFSLKN